MAPDDRKIMCTTRLGALDVPGLEARVTEPRSLLAFAHCSVTCLSEVRLLDTHTPRSFSVSQLPKAFR